MDVKEYLIKVPIVGNLGKRFINLWRDKSDKRIIKRLGGIPHPIAKIVQHVLIDFNKNHLTARQEWTQEIETKREQLLKKNTPLVDGSFDDEGLYDGNKTVSEACIVSRDPNSARFLYLIAKFLNPKYVLELGTNLGISSAYIAAALNDNKNSGYLITLDASPYRQRIAKETHQSIGLENIKYDQGLFYDILDDSLNQIRQVDLAFIDGHHQYDPTLYYLEKIYPYSNPGSVFIFDDIRYSDGMKKAWEEIRNDERFDLVIDLKNIGICVCKGEERSRRFVIPTIYNIFRD
ncbi:O-methyltransferase [Rhodohalobacter sp. 614A]|uniref:O-methyltransferase n=1 Tax=Rhodohalobacter sp. 614A TaxID=2908649 RepID=UPI001F25C3CB|nr:class I SAM-dependent methyltransferase [Rhodohalobacter sp. 614A]